MYFKPTDTHKYTPLDSCHVHHVAKNIPYGVAVVVDGCASLRQTLIATTKLVVVHFKDRDSRI